MDPFCYLYYLYYAVLSVPCSLVITCWERADLLALLCVMFYCVFVTFLYCVSGQVWYLNASIPDLCLFYFDLLVFLFCVLFEKSYDTSVQISFFSFRPYMIYICGIEKQYSTSHVLLYGNVYVKEKTSITCTRNKINAKSKNACSSNNI